MTYILFSLINKINWPQREIYVHKRFESKRIKFLAPRKFVVRLAKLPITGFTDIFRSFQEDTIFTTSHKNCNSSHFSGMPMLVRFVNFRVGKTNKFFGLRKEFVILEV